MQAEPSKPCERPLQPNPAAQLRNRRAPADCCHRALVLVIERLCRAAVEEEGDLPRGVLPTLKCRLRQLWQRVARTLADARRHISYGKDIVKPGDAEVGANLDPAAGLRKVESERER